MILAKRLTDKQKEEIIEGFINGKTIEELSIKFSCTKLTISRNLKKKFGDKNFKDHLSNKKSLNENFNLEENLISNKVNRGEFDKGDLANKNIPNKSFSDQSIPNAAFFEIAPLDIVIDNEEQKDLSSIPIEDMIFPKIVYMIVDNRIELITNLLKDFPEWQFLSKDDLTRKTLKIYFDLKIAKRDCTKDQKVIKIPNPEVFKIVAPILVSRGISRLVGGEKLIAL